MIAGVSRNEMPREDGGGRRVTDGQLGGDGEDADWNVGVLRRRYEQLFPRRPVTRAPVQDGLHVATDIRAKAGVCAARNDRIEGHHLDAPEGQALVGARVGRPTILGLVELDSDRCPREVDLKLVALPR